ncbi:MAG: hypothetical protein ACRCYW_00990 [Aeromonas sp.]
MSHTPLFTQGCVLAHYDAQCKEGSGSGVAVATGWQVAGHILDTAQ